ncbi:Gfo/Idh/MocA family protein (plasmid) [Haloferacaceae archaeon DSL9]
MVRIGIVGLDTSHAESYAAAIRRNPAATLTSVWDGGDVRSESYTRRYCDRNGATLHDGPLELVDDVDAVMILSADWNTHRPLSVPFLRRGVPAMIDKPIAGSLEDVRAIRSAAEHTPLFGGSAVPYHPALRTLQANGEGRMFYCVGYNDPFYYGPHVVDTLRFLVDSRWSRVTPAEDPGQTADIEFVDGTRATVRLDDPRGREQFTFFRIGDRTAVRSIGNSERDLTELYRGYLDAFVETVTGAREPPAERVFDAATLLLGVNAALEERCPVVPTCDTLSTYEADGDAFLDAYQPYY